MSHFPMRAPPAFRCAPPARPRWRWRLAALATGIAALAPASQAGTLTTLHTFAGPADGAYPVGGVVLDDAGNLYGQATQGGAACTIPGGYPASDGCGTLYKIDPSGAFTTLVSFSGHNGAYGQGSLAIAGPQLFGATAASLALPYGLIYGVQTSGAGFHVLHRFVGHDGVGPRTSPIVTASHTLYGVALYGGPQFASGFYTSGYGVLFAILSNGRFVVLHNFTAGADGAYPGQLVTDSAGVLYGSALGGVGLGGVIYSFNPASNVFSVLASLDIATQSTPYLGGVGADGTIYGASSYGGANGLGTLFALQKNGPGYTLQTLWNFTGGADGATPLAGPAVSPAGVLTGATAGDPLGNGSGLYQYANATLTPLASFGPYNQATPPAPTRPLDQPTPGATGIIYGTTSFGGPGPCFSASNQPEGCGTVFSYAP